MFTVDKVDMRNNHVKYNEELEVYYYMLTYLHRASSAESLTNRRFNFWHYTFIFNIQTYIVG